MANTLKTPKVMPSEFCADGDKNTILTSPSTSNPQLANFSTGFPAITQTPIPNGGIPPERADFNGMFNLLSSALVYIQNGGQWTFVPEVSNAIGGYPAGAILNYYDATHKVNKRVVSNINNNVNNFLLDPSQIGDSSKPWSYTENTPIVQDLTNPSADTVPSTKAVSDESSRIVSIMDTELAKKLNVNATTIGEIIDLRTPRLNEGNTSTVYIDGYMINSNDDINGCLVAPELNANGTICFRLLARKKVNGVNMYRGLKVGIKADGSLYTNLEPSNENSSIVTTFSHGSNYVRFGNGVQICWGITARENISTVNLPQAFKDNAYVVLALPSEGSSNTSDLYVHSKTTTQFKLQEQVQKPEQRQWLALGYWY